MTELKENYDVIKDASATAYDLLSLLFPKIPGWVAGRRAICYINICQSVNNKLNNADIPQELRRYCSLKIGVPWVEEASLEEDPILQDLWANLMANVQNPNFSESKLRAAFITIIKDLSTLDVKVLKHIQNNSSPRWIFGRVEYRRSFPIKRSDLFASSLGEKSEEIEISLRNLMRLELIDNKHTASFNAVDNTSPISDKQIQLHTQDAVIEGSYYLTELGLAFLNACVKDAGKYTAEISETDKYIQK